MVSGDEDVVSVQDREDEDPQEVEDVVGEEEIEEAVRPVALRDPGQPTKREREEHELTHLPSRPWCEFCMRGRSQHDQHGAVERQDGPEEVAIPTVGLDYTFIGNRRTKASDNPMLVVYDNGTNALGAWQAFRKGPVERIAKDVARWIGTLGYSKTRITLKSDGETSIKALKDLIASYRHTPTASVETRTRERQHEQRCHGSPHQVLAIPIQNNVAGCATESWSSNWVRESACQLVGLVGSYVT